MSFYSDLLVYSIGAFVLYHVYQAWQRQKLDRCLKRWTKNTKDVVILHGFPPAITIPNASPYVLKVQTYLRLANIPHKMDFGDLFGPKGKAPWITLNGTHVADSEMIISFLSKTFDKNLNASYTEDQLAIATLIRVVLEEHVSWGLALERFVYGVENIKKLIKLEPLQYWVIKFYYGWMLNSRARAQGIGVHSKEEVINFISKDLKAISRVLGRKKFICGETACAEDCGIFAMLAQFIWGSPNSPYEKLLNESELSNLKDYCFRMKQQCFADWDYCLAKM